MNDTLPENTSATAQPSHAAITRRAQALWEQYGRPTGRDEEIWYEAERTLKNETPNALATAPEATPPPLESQLTAVPKTSPTATPKTAQSSRAVAAAKIPTLRATQNGGR